MRGTKNQMLGPLMQLSVKLQSADLHVDRFKIIAWLV